MSADSLEKIGRDYAINFRSQSMSNEAERAAFEADAGPMGFDLTRGVMDCQEVEPWTEYLHAATGDRWAGWLARALSPTARAPQPEICEWKPDDDGLWWSACGGDPWVFEAEGAVENRVLFCMHCGKPTQVRAALSTQEPQP